MRLPQQLLSRVGRRVIPPLHADIVKVIREVKGWRVPGFDQVVGNSMERDVVVIKRGAEFVEREVVEVEIADAISPE